MSDLVFDNTPLSHFSRAGRLDALRSIVQPYRCVVPGQVVTEIRDGLSMFAELTSLFPELGKWLWVEEITDIEDVVAFAKYKAELGGGEEEQRRAAVLAWTKGHGGTAIIDERAGTRIAQRDGITVTGHSGSS